MVVFFFGFPMDEHVINNGDMALKSLLYLAHLLLVMFQCRLNPKRHLIETESAKWCDECRQQVGIWIKRFLPNPECVVPENIHTPPPHRRLFDLHPLPPRIFHFRGSLMIPLPPGISRILIGDFLPPSEIHSRFCTYKRRKWILSWLRKCSRIILQLWKY